MERWDTCPSTSVYLSQCHRRRIGLTNLRVSLIILYVGITWRLGPEQSGQRVLATFTPSVMLTWINQGQVRILVETHLDGTSKLNHCISHDDMRQ